MTDGSTPLLEIRDLRVHFPLKEGLLRVDRCSLNTVSRRDAESQRFRTEPVRPEPFGTLRIEGHFHAAWVARRHESLIAERRRQHAYCH